MPKTATKIKAPKKMTRTIRLLLDDTLELALVFYRQKYPLLSNLEIVKVMLSDGLKSQNFELPKEK
jgi:hypothetical protein